jgi:hypothetical protein
MDSKVCMFHEYPLCPSSDRLVDWLNELQEENDLFEVSYILEVVFGPFHTYDMD